MRGGLLRRTLSATIKLASATEEKRDRSMTKLSNGRVDWAQAISLLISYLFVLDVLKIGRKPGREETVSRESRAITHVSRES